MTGTDTTGTQADTGYRRNYFRWLWQQLHGWPIQNYMLWFFAFGFQLGLLVSHPFTWVSVVTFFATIVGTLCVLAINATKAVNGWLGIISSAGFIAIAIAAKNYLAVFEQVAYILTLDLPILLAVKSWNDDTKNHLRTFTPRLWAVAIAGTAVVWVLSAWGIGAWTDDPRPWIDGFSFSISLTAGIMCFLRYNNQFYWWLASAVAQLVLWAVTFAQGDASIAMAINSLIYLINDVLAFTTSAWFDRGRRKMGLKPLSELDGARG